MADPVLHLVVDKGPKKGETLDRKPGTLVRIGRVVKGNTFAIKDPAISQHHLVIRFLPELSRWTLEDLGTSNGTLINDVKVPPSDPFPLSDGDTIKIGESTSISVGIGAEEKSEVPRRNGPNRRGRPKKADHSICVVAVKDEILERVVEERVEEPKNLRTGRARRGKDVVVAEVLVEESRNLRRGRSRRGDSSGLLVEDSIKAPKNAGRTRARRAPPRTRASSTTEEETLSSNSEVEEVAGEEELDGDCDGGKKSKMVGSAEEAENIERVEEETTVDIERLTLGEWFDSMEKFLPMSVNDVAEGIISSLREKARRFDEFVGKAWDAC